jgi:hypothetical protein
MMMLLNTIKTLCLWYTAYSLAVQLPWGDIFEGAITCIAFTLKLACCVCTLLPWGCILDGACHTLATVANRWIELVLIAIGLALCSLQMYLLTEVGNATHYMREIRLALLINKNNRPLPPPPRRGGAFLMA